jgi:zinc protease
MAKPNVSLEELEKALEVELAAMRDKGPTKEEVDRVKTAIRAGRIRGLQSAAGRADLVQRYNHYLGDPDSLAKDFARYDAVTPATVKKQTQTWLDPARRVVVTVTPRGR